MTEYEVILANNFEATSPLDALAQMTAWVAEAAYQAGYRITNVDTGESFFMDAETVNWNDLRDENVPDNPNDDYEIDGAGEF